MPTRRIAKQKKCGQKATQKINAVMQEYGEGGLKSGKSGKKVTDRKQAVAIAISEAREMGYKVPNQKNVKTKKNNKQERPAKGMTGAGAKKGATKGRTTKKKRKK